MSKARGFLFLSSLLLLASCAEGPAPEPPSSESSLEESPSLTPSSEESSEQIPSSEPALSQGSWSLDSSAIQDTEQNQYLNSYSFALTDSLGSEVFFYGDYIQRGKGEWEGTLQMKKGVSYIECRTLLSGTLSLSIKKRVSSYGDFTGTPVFSLSPNSLDWAEKGGAKKEEGDAVVYSYSFTSSYFRFAAGEKNALYLLSASFIPSAD